jgi:DDE domain
VPIFQQFAGGRPSGRDDVRQIPLSLRNVEDLLAERGIDISYETVRFWWNRFGPMFAAEIRKNRVAHVRSYPQWRWHLDEAFVKISGKLCYLWRAVDQGARGGPHSEAGQGGGAEASQASHEEIPATEDHRHRRTSRLFGGDE